MTHSTMEKQEVIDRLSRALAVEARSLLAYLCLEADLSLPESTPEAVALYEQIRATTEDHIRILADRVLAAGGQIDLDSFPMAFLRYNYVTVDHVLPRLAEGLEAVTRGLEDGAAAFSGLDSSAATLLSDMAQRRRRQREKVMALRKSREPGPEASAGPAPPPAAVAETKG